MEEKEIYNTSNLSSVKEKAAREIFYEHIVPLARESFEHDGGISPMVFLFLDDGSEDKVAITPMPAKMFMETEDKKEILSEILKEFTNVIEVVAIGMFAEAWGTIIDKEKDTSVKEEIIYYSFESENLVLMLTDNVIREENKPAQLKYGVIHEDISCSGKFVGFLKDMKKVKLN